MATEKSKDNWQLHRVLNKILSAKNNIEALNALSEFGMDVTVDTDLQKLCAKHLSEFVERQEAG